PMASRELEQSVVLSDVVVGIANEDVGVADVRCHDRETDQPADSRGAAALFHAAGGGREVFVADHPLLRELVTADDEVRHCSGGGGRDAGGATRAQADD